MMPLVPLLQGLALAAVLGALGYGALRLVPARASWPLVAALSLGIGIALGHALALSPLTALLLLALLVLMRHTARGAPEPPPANSLSDDRRALGLLLVAAGLFIWARPAVPLYWDELVWLEKARLEAAGFGELRRAALDPSSGVIPPGYPILWPLVTGWLGGFQRDAASLLAGSGLLRIACLALFAALTASPSSASSPSTARPQHAGHRLGWVLLFGTPLVAVHLRTAYVDLPVGLLAATVAVGLVRTLEEPELVPLLGALTAAAWVVGAKDEGMAHVALLSGLLGAVALRRRDWRALGRCLLVLAAGGLPFVTWRLLIAAAHVVDSDHALGAPVLSALGPLLVEYLRNMADLRSWGILWPVTIAFVAVAAWRRQRAAGGPRPLEGLDLLGLCLVADLLLGLAGLLCGPERVRIFATNGTLVNRMLVQLAPLASVVAAGHLARLVGWTSSAGERGR
jgi:hypothetical protein